MRDQTVRSILVSHCNRRWRRACGLAVVAVVALWLCQSTSVAADRPPEIEKAIQKGVGYLRASAPNDAEIGLAIYAALAAGTSPEDAWVQAQLAKILKKFSSDGYKPL